MGISSCRIFLHHMKKAKPVYNEILLTTLGKSFCLGSRGDRASKAHQSFACFWEPECQLICRKFAYNLSVSMCGAFFLY